MLSFLIAKKSISLVEPHDFNSAFRIDYQSPPTISTGDGFLFMEFVWTFIYSYGVITMFATNTRKKKSLSSLFCVTDSMSSTLVVYIIPIIIIWVHIRSYVIVKKLSNWFSTEFENCIYTVITQTRYAV